MSAATIMPLNNNLVIRNVDLTTTTIASNTIKCEGVKEPYTADSCRAGACPQGMNCVYTAGSQTAAAYIPPMCICQKSTTTTTQPTGIRCEQVQSPNEKTCMAGICPNSYQCQYYQVAGAPSYCKCTPKETTSTTLPRCERIQSPNEKTCMAGLCPEGTRCTYRASPATTTAYIPPACVCIGATTTTVPSQVKCEGMQNPAEKTCAVGLCPEGTRCVYKAGPNTAVAYIPPKCVCEPGATTTTTMPSYTWCEKLDSPSGPVCLKGLCPPNTVCRYFGPNTQATYLAAASAGGRCKCIPCDCDVTTTTTIPASLRCEAVKSPSANTCAAGLCPSNYKCDYVQSPTGAQGVCKCTPVTTTTQPGERKCEEITATNEGKCVQGLCPDNTDCKYILSTSAAGVPGHCRCVPKATTTTQPTVVECSAVAEPSANTCAVAKCPPGEKCTVVTINTAAAQLKKCVCAQAGGTTTTLRHVVQNQGLFDRILSWFG